MGVAIRSTFSLGWRTLVRDLLPVRTLTVAPCSNEPGLVGLTRNVINRSEPEGSKPIGQVKASPTRVASGWLVMS